MKIEIQFEIKDFWVGVRFAGIRKIRRAKGYYKVFRLWVCLIPCFPIYVEERKYIRYEIVEDKIVEDEIPKEPRTGMIKQLVNIEQKPKTPRLNKLSLNKLDEYLFQFVDKIENERTFDEKLYKKILKKSVAWNKEEVLQDMVKQIEIFDDYDEEEVNFNYKPHLDKLSQSK